MRISLLVMVLVAGCGHPSGGANVIALPLVYPPVRATTPTSLINDSSYKPQSLRLGPNDMPVESLATVVQARLYSMGPTEILRILREIDDRTMGLDTRPSQHPCLTATPVDMTYTLPGGQTFVAKLQCQISLPAGPVAMSDGWIAFGFDRASSAADDADGGASDDGGSTEGRGDFYLVEGMSNGMGGVYRISTASGNVEGWIAVADKTAPSGSQVLVHLVTDKAAGTTEIALGGAGVGFCQAHLKMNADHLYIGAKTNAPPPLGTDPMPGVQYCSDPRTGCYATAALDTDLGGDAADCATLAPATFSIATELDASNDPSKNVDPSTIYTYLSTAPTGIAPF